MFSKQSAESVDKKACYSMSGPKKEPTAQLTLMRKYFTSLSINDFQGKRLIKGAESRKNLDQIFYTDYMKC